MNSFIKLVSIVFEEKKIFLFKGASITRILKFKRELSSLTKVKVKKNESLMKKERDY